MEGQTGRTLHSGGKVQGVAAAGQERVGVVGHVNCNDAGALDLDGRLGLDDVRAKAILLVVVLDVVESNLHWQTVR